MTSPLQATNHFGDTCLIDGRDNDAIMAISAAIDKGIRWQHLLTRPYFNHLQDNERFQALVSRMKDLVRFDRAEILALLCGPNTILNMMRAGMTLLCVWLGGQDDGLDVTLHY